MRPYSIIFIFLVVAIISSCGRHTGNTEIIEGDLYYDWIRFGSFYKVPDNIVQKVKHLADTINHNKLTPSEEKVLSMFTTLKKRDLLYSPLIDLKLDDESIVKLYFSKENYDKLTHFNYQSLVDRKKKIRIKAEVDALEKNMYYCNKLIFISEVNGQTFQANPKLKIDDYR